MIKKPTDNINLFNISTHSEGNLFYYLTISIIVILGSIYSIYGIDALLLDDLARYYEVAKDKFPIHIRQRSFLLAYTEWFSWKLMYISPILARWVIVLFELIPLSIVFFILLKQYLKLPTTLSLAASVIPNILPGQQYIPSFVNGSYTVYGLLYTLIMLIILLNVIASRRTALCLFFAPIIVFISSQLMTQAIFLFPSITILIIFYNGKIKDKIIVISSLIGVFFFKYYWVKNNQTEINTSIELSLEQITKRLDNFFSFTSIFPLELDIFHTTIIILCLLVSWLIFVKNPKSIFKYDIPFPGYNYYINISIIYLFFISWVICSSFVFITQSPHFPSRYLHISSFGVNALLLLIVFGFFSLIKVSRYFRGFIILLILFTLWLRQYNLYHSFLHSNTHLSYLKNLFSKVNIPKDSQVYAIGSFYETGGYWNWGTGYLQYAAGRDDIIGHVYPELSYYDAFEMNRSYSREKIVRGFDIDKPFFAFRVKNNLDYTPVKYMLRWLNDDIDSEWIVYKTIGYGYRAKIAIGSGINDYLYFINNNNFNLSNKQILWGGCPKKEAINRLNLNAQHIKDLCS